MSALITHEPSGLQVDPNLGLVFYANGKQAGLTTADGYPVAMVRGSPSCRLYPLALVVYEAVHGPLSAGMTLRRVNGERCDIRVSNLQAVPKSEVSHDGT